MIVYQSIIGAKMDLISERNGHGRGHVSSPDSCELSMGKAGVLSTEVFHHIYRRGH
jgi:hypothetical protein